MGGSQRYAVQPISATGGFIRAGTGAAPSSRMAGNQTMAAPSQFVNPDGTAFYPGGTTWYVPLPECHTGCGIIM